MEDEKLNRKPSARLENNGLQSTAPSVQSGLDAHSISEIRARRKEQHNTVLPNPPRLPGFHSTWIGGEGASEPQIMRRFMTDGYTPITWAEASQHDTTWRAEFMPGGVQGSDIVSVNEKKAYKVPLEIYYDIMKEQSHDEPFGQEGAQRAELKERSMEEHGLVLKEEDDGLAFAQARSKKPSFDGVVNTAK